MGSKKNPKIKGSNKRKVKPINLKGLNRIKIQK
jgi:hypothetical protein